MKYRITEHRNGNNEKHYTIEVLRKNIFWGESWQVKTFNAGLMGTHPMRFDSRAEALRHVKARRWSEQVVEEGEV